MTDGLGMIELVAVVACALAALMSVIAFRAVSLGRAGPNWPARAKTVEARANRLESLLGTYPGLVLAWDAVPGAASSSARLRKPRSDGAAGAAPAPPARLLGSTAALASLRRFADAGAGADLGSQIVAGLDAQDVVGGERSLRDLVGALRARGETFAVSVILPEGSAIDVAGRVAGDQALVWIDDPALHNETESDALARLGAKRAVSRADPLAFLDILDRASFPVWRTDSAGRITWANPAFVASVEAANLADVRKRQLQLDPQCAAQVRAALATGARQFDTRAVVVRGQRRSLGVMVYRVAGGTAGIAMDATEADTLRNALVSHIRAHDETLNALQEGVVIFGPDQAMRFHNRAFSDIFGLGEAWYGDSPSHGAWLDRLRESRMLPEQADYQGFKQSELALYTDPTADMSEGIWPLPDGRLLRVVRQREPEGGLLLLFTDMTDQMTLRGQLGQLIAVQRATLDRLSEGIAVFGSDGALRLCNRAFARLWDIEPGALEEGTRFHTLLEGFKRLHMDAAFWQAVESRITDPNPDIRQLAQGELARSDGRYLQWLSRPLPDGATLLAFEDRTEARRARVALEERNAALEQANRIKSEFVGHVSYQLRTPLTTIAGYADLLQGGAAGELSDKQSEYLFSVQSAARELEKSINDILDIAAIEANVLDLDIGEADVFDLLSTTLDYVATRAEETRIQVSLDCPDDIGVIRADAPRIKQVVYNLLLNALRFTKPGGRIELGARRQQGGFRIWVEDTGVGIPTHKQAQVFESFQGSRGGTGLGLALVLKFVERHGGWVEMKSQEGVGTHVTCYLPADAGPWANQAQLGLDSAEAPDVALPTDVPHPAPPAQTATVTRLQPKGAKKGAKRAEAPNDGSRAEVLGVAAAAATGAGALADGFAGLDLVQGDS